MKMVDTLIENTSGVAKAAVFLILVVVLTPATLLYKRLAPDQPFKIPRLFHGLLLRLFGIRLQVIGTPSSATPVFFVANHVSYLDILVLGSLLPAAFVAKADVASWPLFGFLAKIQNTLFIERRATRAAAQRTQLQIHLAKRQSLILFPEGTSSDGMNVLPFKSSLFSIVTESAPDIAITIQPISLTCTALDGFPLLREQRPLYGWYGDMTLLPHLWNVFKRGRFTVEVIFHPPMAAGEHPDRKILAATCQSLVARGIEQSLRGNALA